MKVTITCEKCGGRIIEGGGYQDAAHLARRFSDGSELVCPHCAKLSYGPLTEELVAEALENAATPDMSWEGAWQEGYRREARFVLRLLDSLNAIGSDSYCRLTNTDASARRELLDLARKP